MTEATTTNLMDTERGGENTQYESQNTFTQPPDKDSGTFKDTTNAPSEASLQAATDKKARGEKTAENVRYGQAVSQYGMGGTTVGNSGGAGGTEGNGHGNMRRTMGYEDEGGDEIGG